MNHLSQSSQLLRSARSVAIASIGAYLVGCLVWWGFRSGFDTAVPVRSLLVSIDPASAWGALGAAAALLAVFGGLYVVLRGATTSMKHLSEITTAVAVCSGTAAVAVLANPAGRNFAGFLDLAFTTLLVFAALLFADRLQEECDHTREGKDDLDQIGTAMDAERADLEALSNSGFARATLSWAVSAALPVAADLIGRLSGRIHGNAITDNLETVALAGVTIIGTIALALIARISALNTWPRLRLFANSVAAATLILITLRCVWVTTTTNLTPWGAEFIAISAATLFAPAIVLWLTCVKAAASKDNASIVDWLLVRYVKRRQAELLQRAGTRQPGARATTPPTRIQRVSYPNTPMSPRVSRHQRRRGAARPVRL